MSWLTANTAVYYTYIMNAYDPHVVELLVIYQYMHRHDVASPLSIR
jgi:hypothetical protein